MTQLVLLDGEAQPIVVVVGHGELVWMVARLHHDRLTAVLIVGCWAVRA